jgi:hypothetical protein
MNEQSAPVATGHRLACHVLHLVMLGKTFSALSIEINKVRNAIMMVECAECKNSRGQLAHLFYPPARKR